MEGKRQIQGENPYLGNTVSVTRELMNQALRQINDMFIYRWKRMRGGGGEGEEVK